MFPRGFLFLGFVSTALVAAPPAVWDGPVTLAPADLPGALAKVDEAAKAMPPELGAAVSLQRLLLKIRAGAPIAEWREAMGKYAGTKETAPAAAGLRELALAWEARARMAEIDAVLRAYYRRQVRFPVKLDEVTLPATAKTDPWGDAWGYALAAPKGLSAKLSDQRYTLTAGKHPQVRDLAATLAEPAPERSWKLAVRQVAGQRVLEVRTAAATVATQAGGRVEDATVLYLGDGWALFADLERIFTVKF